MARGRTYIIHLEEKEKKLLRHLKRTAKNDTIKTRCKIVLAADKFPKLTYEAIGGKAGASEPTVISTIKAYCSGGIEALKAIGRSVRSNCARLKVDGDLEAKLIAKACSSPPAGATAWTIDLLTDELTIILQEDPSIGIESVGRSSVARAMKRNSIRPHLSEYWCIPPSEDAGFVARMEEVLDLYKMPYDIKRPLYCFDEKPYQLLDHAREPLPMRPGDIQKIDSEYVREGTVSIFCFIQPHTGKIIHSVEETRTAVDFAEKMKLLVDEIEPDAEKIVLVMDNLNTHSIDSLYKAFTPAEARRIARKLEIHYTPKHGSWLDIAEIGINIMTRECLNQRIKGIDELRKKLRAWQDRYDKDPTPIQWQFTPDKARIKLKSLYPDIDKSRKERDRLREEKKKKLGDETKPNEKK